MKVIEKKRTAYKFNVYGKEYTVNAPTMRQVDDFQTLVDKGDKTETALSIEFLGALGVPSEDAWEMEPHHLNDIIKTVCAQKK